MLIAPDQQCGKHGMLHSRAVSAMANSAMPPHGVTSGWMMSNERSRYDRGRRRGSQHFAAGDSDIERRREDVVTA